MFFFVLLYLVIYNFEFLLHHLPCEMSMIITTVYNICKIDVARYFKLALLLTLFWLDGFAYEHQSRHPHIGFRSGKGFIIQHSRDVASISHSNPWSLEFDLGFHYATERAWNYCNCFPRAGLTLSYFNYNNPDVLGNGYGIMPYIEPFLTPEKPLSISLRAGLGLVYLDNVFHPINNPENHFYSTKISFLAHANISLNYRINQEYLVKLSANYNHISNGSIKQPNKGINYPMVSVGVDYNFSNPDFTSHEFTNYSQDEIGGSFLRISPYFTLKETSKDDMSQYPIMGLSVRYGWKLRRLSSFTVGIDGTWDGSVRQRIREEGIDGSDHKRLAVALGHDLLIGRVLFYQQVGAYIYSPYKPRDPIYQRYGIAYHVARNIYVGLNLKAHRHVADFLDFRVTFTI